jgi:hypothetical protein
MLFLHIQIHPVNTLTEYNKLNNKLSAASRQFYQDVEELHTGTRFQCVILCMMKARRLYNSGNQAA